jgi:hypothetical protein
LAIQPICNDADVWAAATGGATRDSTRLPVEPAPTATNARREIVIDSPVLLSKNRGLALSIATQ